MLDKDTRTAILALSRQGYGVRRIARELNPTSRIRGGQRV